MPFSQPEPGSENSSLSPASSQALSSTEPSTKAGLLALPKDPALKEVVLAAHAHLGRRAWAGRELARRLLRGGFEQDLVEAALTWLTERGLVNDQAYAAAAVRSATQLRGWGRRKVEHWLQARGVADEVVDDAYDHEAAEGEAERARELAVRQAGRGKTAAQIFRFLVGRGYAAGLARQLAWDVASNNSEDEPAGEEQTGDEPAGDEGAGADF